MEQRVLEIVNLVLENRSKTKVNSLSPHDKLRETLGFDSLDLAELTVRIEDEFGVDIFNKYGRRNLFKIRIDVCFSQRSR